jgi:outer membrane protein
MSMGTQYRKRLIIAGMIAVIGLTAGAAAAAQGDLIVRVGPTLVNPNDDSGELSGVAGGKVSVDSAVSLGITLTWMATDNIGLSLLGAYPFKHDIKGAGELAALGKIAETKQLPPTFTVQYHFQPGSNIRPYVGAGLNYTTFFSEKTSGDIAGTSISLDDSFGWAVEAGVDIDLNADWFISGQLWYIAIDTTAKLGDGLGNIDVDIDPLVAMLGFGRRF